MWNNKIIWSEGMFLRPHHFQQQERYFANLVELRSAPLRPDPWGFTQLKLDDQLLALGKVGVASASGVFADGVPFHIPSDDELPEPLDFPDSAKNQVVVRWDVERNPVREDTAGG